MPHHYIRLCIELDPSIILERKSIKSDVIDGDETSSQTPRVAEESWMAQHKWYINKRIRPADRDRAIQFQDTPDAAKRPTTTRTVFTAQVYQGNPVTFLDKLNQEYHYEYLLKGHRLIHNNIIITVFQIFKVLISATQLIAAQYRARDQRWGYRD